jgi:hypothetical protein
MRAQIFEHPEDVNRSVVQWLQRNTRPSDEILINYEDYPLMYYLPNPIRGGIAAYRVEDDSKSPPRFLVLRPNVSFVYWPAFLREARRFQWQREPVIIPSDVWGNNPDPGSEVRTQGKPEVLILRRVDDGK